MQDGGGMLDLAALAYDGGLTITFRAGRLDAERLHAALAQQPTELLADVDQRRQIFLVATGARIFDHGDRHRAAGRRLDRPAHLHADLVYLHYQLSDLGFHLEFVLAKKAKLPTFK
jgi:hypothetical protein